MEQARLNATLRGQDITIRGQNLTARDRRTKNRIAKQRLQRSGPGGKPRFTTVQLTRARSQWHKGVTYANILKSKGFLGKHPNESVAGLTRKGIDEPIARGVVQTLLYGGVRPHHRRFLEHNYGLRPKIASRFRRGNVFGHSFPVNLFRELAHAARLRRRHMAPATQGSPSPPPPALQLRPSARALRPPPSGST
jgi:hypothetical protein